MGVYGEPGMTVRDTDSCDSIIKNSLVLFLNGSVYFNELVEGMI